MAFLGRFNVVAFCLVAIASAGLSQSAVAVPTLTFDESSKTSNSQHTGASGKVDWTLSDAGNGEVLVTWDIYNTTGTDSFGAGATTSKLTGFGINLPTGVSYVKNSFSGGSYLDTPIENAKASPDGTLAIAAADNTNWLGGNANGALPQGLSDSVSLKLTGLSLAAMEQAFTVGFTSSTDTLLAVMRFQQVNAGAESDKLVYRPSLTPPTSTQSAMVPEPTSLAIWGLVGIAGISGVGRRRRSGCNR